MKCTTPRTLAVEMLSGEHHFQSLVLSQWKVNKVLWQLLAKFVYILGNNRRKSNASLEIPKELAIVLLNNFNVVINQNQLMINIELLKCAKDYMKLQKHFCDIVVPKVIANILKESK